MQYNHTERLFKVTTHKVAFTTVRLVTGDGGGNDGLYVEKNHVHSQIHWCISSLLLATDHAQ